MTGQRPFAASFLPEALYLLWPNSRSSKREARQSPGLSHIDSPTGFTRARQTLFIAISVDRDE